MIGRLAFLPLLVAAQWQPLPGLRCHDDIGQTHNVSSLTSCEQLCDSAPGCSVVSYCPLPGAADCSASVPSGPQPLTCWLYPASALPCSPAQGAGWQSASKPAPPPAPPILPPSDWAALVAAGDMAFSSLPPELIGEGFFPVVGNGFLAVEMGPFLQPFTNAWPWRDAGALKLSGVYNGRNFAGPSHRAQLPRLTALTLLPAPGAPASSYSVVGTAVHFSTGTFLNRTRLTGAGTGCSNGTIIEQRTFAHRAHRELLVHQVTAFPESLDYGSWGGCSGLLVHWDPSPATPDASLARSSSASGQAAVFSGSTLVGEEAQGLGATLRSVAMAFNASLTPGTPPAGGNGTIYTLAFTPQAPTLTLLAVLRSDLDVGPPGAPPAAVAAAALATWTQLGQQSLQALLDSHATASAALWSSGIELQGNASLAAALNASLYDIAASLREDWPWSTSPGGLATGGYSSHTFWDMETWMFPVLTLLFPALARQAAQYRFDRVGASLINAASLNESGTHFAWESAATGLWASPWRGADFSEIHLDADIPLAMRRYYLATGDLGFLRQAWPLLNGTCTFWECRLTRSDTPAGAPPPPGYPSGCSSKAGSGNWTVRGVIPPDESSGTVDDSVYTNAGAAQTLAWCLQAASALGLPPSSLPPLWAQAAAAPYLPLSSTLTAAGPVHPQNKGYAGKTINQADVALLQYPLGLDFGAEQNARDLDYYAARTDFAGMFTGDSSYACAYLALGNRSAADAQLGLAFGHITSQFRVFTETEISGDVPGVSPPATSGTQHFITGSGGLLQAFLFGYPGLRIARLGVLSFAASAPLLPPLGVTRLTLRGLHLLGASFSLAYDASTLCVWLLQGSAQQQQQLELRVLASGQRVQLTTQQACVSVQAVEVAGVGFA